MKEVFLVLMQTGTLTSKIIKRRTHYKYAHVLIGIDNEYKKMYSFGRKHIYNIFNAGLVINGIDSKFYKVFNKCQCRIYRIKVTEEKYEKLQNVLQNFEEKEKFLKYDIIGLILRGFGIAVNRKNHYVCTQFVAQVLKESNIYVFNKKYEDIKPQDFEQIQNMEQIYEGYFLDLGGKNDKCNRSNSKVW